MENSKNTSGNLIVDLSFQFAVQIVAFTEQLESQRKYNLARQLFRCGTSIGANIREAQGAESLADFIHKIKIASKEAEETRYWLDICLASESYVNPEQLRTDIESILRILGKILITSINKK